LTFTFLDVGQGDSVVIGFPDGRHWVVDAGGLRLAPSQEDSAYAFDIGEAVVSRFLWQGWNTKLDRLVLSHSDLDHSGGMASLLKNFKVNKFNHSPAEPDEILTGILNVARKRHVKTGPIHSGVEERISGVTVRVLHPPMNAPHNSANENSLVLAFSFKRFSALLTGDLERSGEADSLARITLQSSLVLKVAHHGSRWGTSDAFLDQTSPRWAVISVGRHNPFGHPSKEVMLRLLRHRVRTLLTTDEGAIGFETDGNAYRIWSHVRGILAEGVLQ
jgi:competence protein ComEC